MTDVKPTVDPYRVLGVSRGADLDQIKAAHRQLAKRFHPDGSTGDEKRFLAVQEAYQLLADPLRRREWDRRHAPGPVRAGNGAGSRDRSGDGAGRRRGPTRPERRAGPLPRRPARDRRTRGHTWSAERVPWWEDFTPRNAAAAGRPGPSPRAAQGAATAQGRSPSDLGPDEAFDLDVFDRSSGAAWSMAARRHFRRGEADLPSRGAWRYRGTQVVTGAEARKVAAEEAAAEGAARAAEQQRRANEAALFRQRSRATAAERQAFDHEPAVDAGARRGRRPTRDPNGEPPRDPGQARRPGSTQAAGPHVGASPASVAGQPRERSAPDAPAVRTPDEGETRSRSLTATLSGYLRSRLGGPRHPGSPADDGGGGRER